MLWAFNWVVKECGEVDLAEYDYADGVRAGVVPGLMVGVGGLPGVGVSSVTEPTLRAQVLLIVVGFG